MNIYGEEISLHTKGFSDIHDITPEVAEIVRKAEIKKGFVHVFSVGSTASISTIEFEPALVNDMQEKLEDLVSKNEHHHHSHIWGDDN